MLVYLTGTENIKHIENAIYEIQIENDLFIGEPIKSNNINLLQEVKSTLCKNKEINSLIIDLSVLVDSDEDIIKAIKTLRFYNNNCKFIIVATEREIGDSLLSEMVNMGIYNIIVNDDELLGKIKDYTLNEATYKEASIFQIEDKTENKEKKKKLKTKAEKIKNNATKHNDKVIIKPLKGKIIISIIGTQSRVGVTHNSILMAYNLMKKGYKVAVIEYNKKSDYKYLANCYENTRQTNEVSSYIRINQIDFYLDIDKDLLGKIEGINYDYLIIDNGDINSCDIAEHNRADVKIVIFGSAAWEQEYLSKIFQLGKEVIVNYRYLTKCDEHSKKDILEEMNPLKVYFENYTPEPFSKDENILDILDGYLYEESKKKKSILGKIFK